MGMTAAAVFAKSAVLIPSVTGVPNKLLTLPMVSLATLVTTPNAPERLFPVVPAAIDCLAVSAMFLKLFNTPLSVPGNPLVA